MSISIRVTDGQAHGPNQMKSMGWIPDTRFPGRLWLRGERLDRPLCGPSGTVFSCTDNGQVFMYFDPIWNIGVLANRPPRALRGTTWYATDTGQIFVWVT